MSLLAQQPTRFLPISTRVVSKLFCNRKSETNGTFVIGLRVQRFSTVKKKRAKTNNGILPEGKYLEEIKARPTSTAEDKPKIYNKYAAAINKCAQSAQTTI